MLSNMGLSRVETSLRSCTFRVRCDRRVSAEMFFSPRFYPNGVSRLESPPKSELLKTHDESERPRGAVAIRRP